LRRLERTLPVGEYLSEDLLLTLPHRQAVQWPALGFVWTIPNVLRSFLRHDRTLFSDIPSSYFSQAAGRTIQGAMVSSHQTFSSFAVWNPHWHTMALVEIWRLSGGKVAEEWYIDDDLGFLQQLGVIPKLNPG
jgi:hypothetical protein